MTASLKKTTHRLTKSLKVELSNRHAFTSQQTCFYAQQSRSVNEQPLTPSFHPYFM